MKFFKTKFPQKSFSFIIVIAIGLGVFSVPSLIKIGRVECSSQYGPCSNFVRENLEKYQGATLRRAKKGISGFLAGEAGVRDFSLRLKLPATLSISLLEKKARYALKDSDRGVYLTVDEAGSVIAIFPETNLPYVEAASLSLNTGEAIPENYAVALATQERLNWAYQVKSSRVKDGFLTVTLPDGYTVYFPLDRDPQELMGALTLILSALNAPPEESKIKLDQNLKTIDLRFKNPVLR